MDTIFDEALEITRESVAQQVIANLERDKAELLVALTTLVTELGDRETYRTSIELDAALVNAAALINCARNGT